MSVEYKEILVFLQEYYNNQCQKTEDERSPAWNAILADDNGHFLCCSLNYPDYKACRIYNLAIYKQITEFKYR